MRNFDHITKDQKKEIKKARKAAKIVQQSELRLLGVTDFDSVNLRRSGRLKTAKIRVR